MNKFGTKYQIILLRMKEGEGKIVYPELSYKIVGVLFEVFNNLGYGYKESTYQKAIENEFISKGIEFVAQKSFLVSYKGKIIARRYLDFEIEGLVILEIKCGNYYARQNLSQVFEYLKATDLRLAILATFAPGGIKYKRIINKIPKRDN